MKNVFFILFLISVFSSSGIADPIKTTGDILAVALPVTAAGITVYKRDWKGTLQLSESLLLSTATVYLLKYTVKEPRPNGFDSLSFPSSHTSFSCTASEFLFKRYGWKYGVPCYALSAFVGYSRIESKYHYFHDVLAGAFIGCVSSYIFTKNIDLQVDLTF
jgi:membrane-associated phospholipid phosphatase